MSLADIKYVVGIDFGAVSSGVSVAQIENPSVKYTVNEWEGTNNQKTKLPKQFLTSILYKTDNTFTCGLSNTTNEKVSRNEGDVYINNIKQYILDIDQANEELGERKKGLTIQKVVTDYLKNLHSLAMEWLKKQEPFCKMEDFKNDSYFKSIRYCLSCPESQKEFMMECFVEADIVKSEDLSYRLVCVTEAEASAYYCLSLDRIKSKIVHDQEYFVCDIGHSSFGMAKIQADTTELLSKVDLISEEPGNGSMNLENNFRRYLDENMSDLNLNKDRIDTLVETFVDDMKYKFNDTQVGTTKKEEDYDELQNPTETSVSGLEVGDKEEISYVFDLLDIRGDPVKITENDLRVHVFSPYIKYITDYIIQKDEDNKNEAKIFLSGHYSSDSYFYEKLNNVNQGKLNGFLAFVDEANSIDVVSLGAVSFGLRFHNLQTPFFIPRSYLTEKEKEKEKVETEKERIETENKRIAAENKRIATENKRIENNLEKKEKPIDFVIGIDFGTTFSGCSYADCRNGGIRDDIPIKTLKSGWPGGDRINFGKTPTLIMYDMEMRAKCWGQDAKQKVDRNPDLTLLGNFKLFLSPKSVANCYGVDNKDIKVLAHENSFSNTVSTEDCPRTSKIDSSKKYKINKEQDQHTVDAVDIISDYLRLFHRHAIKMILRKEVQQNALVRLVAPAVKENFNIRYVLTVPAMWSASAKETMAQASIDAGIITKDELHNLFVITEPEAAALYCDKTYSHIIRNPEKSEAESTFVVCDAGGGTVDLVTFEMKFGDDGKGQICQIGEGCGDTCGSSYLDSKFKEYLMQFYKDINVSASLSDTNFNSVMDQFIHKIKVNFFPDTSRDGYSDIKLPTERLIGDLTGIEKAKKYDLRNTRSVLRIPDSVMQKEIFDPIIDNILSLIDKQINQAKCNKIRSIVMIGGFSRNKYLQKRVEDYYKNEYIVGVPPGGVAAISDGAVSYGLNPRMVSTKSSGQSLALEVQAPFETKNENMNKEVPGPNGEKFVRNRLEYFVKKMESLKDGLYHRTVSVNYPQNVLIAIFSCDFKEGDEADDKNWRYVSRKHSKIMEETIELPKVKGLEGTNIQFDVFLRVDHIGVTVVIECLNPKINDEVKKMNKNKCSSLKIERKCNFVVFRNRKPLIQYSLMNSQFVFGSS